MIAGQLFGFAPTIITAVVLGSKDFGPLGDTEVIHRRTVATSLVRQVRIFTNLRVRFVVRQILGTHFLQVGRTVRETPRIEGCLVGHMSVVGILTNFLGVFLPVALRVGLPDWRMMPSILERAHAFGVSGIIGPPVGTQMFAVARGPLCMFLGGFGFVAFFVAARSFATTLATFFWRQWHIQLPRLALEEERIAAW